MMTLARIGGEQFEALARCRHQFRNAGKIPIRVGYFGMANIGRERGYSVVDIGAVLLPELQPPTNEGVTQIMDAGRIVSAAGLPTEVDAELLKDMMNHAGLQ